MRRAACRAGQGSGGSLSSLQDSRDQHGQVILRLRAVYCVHGMGTATGSWMCGSGVWVGGQHHHSLRCWLPVVAAAQWQQSQDTYESVRFAQLTLSCVSQGQHGGHSQKQHGIKCRMHEVWVYRACVAYIALHGLVGGWAWIMVCAVLA
jgi:hypothetical protein